MIKDIIFGVIISLITTFVIFLVVRLAFIIGPIMLLCVLAIPVYYCYDAIKVRRRRNENKKRRQK